MSGHRHPLLPSFPHKQNTPTPWTTTHGPIQPQRPAREIGISGQCIRSTVAPPGPEAYLSRTSVSRLLLTGPESQYVRLVGQKVSAADTQACPTHPVLSDAAGTRQYPERVPFRAEQTRRPPSNHWSTEILKSYRAAAGKPSNLRTENVPGLALHSALGRALPYSLLSKDTFWKVLPLPLLPRPHPRRALASTSPTGAAKTPQSARCPWTAGVSGQLES